MKRALAGVLAIAFVGLLAAGATAQVPFFQVYFDDDSNGSYGETQAPNCGVVNEFQSLYLVASNFNMFVSAVDYQVDLPPALFFLSDALPTVPGGSLSLGATPATISTEGLAISYGLPRSGFSPMLLTTMTTVWTGACDCATGPGPIIVNGWPGKTSPTGIRWGDFVEVGAVGMTSLVCPGPVSTTETTWGGVKALYR